MTGELLIVAALVAVSWFLVEIRNVLRSICKALDDIADAETMKVNRK